MRSRVLALAAVAIVAAVSGLAILPFHSDAQAPAGRASRAASAKEAMASISIFVDKGDRERALQYYRRISSKLSFPLLDPADKPVADMNQLVEYLGYRGISAADLETLDPELLMPRTQEEFERLAGRVKNSALFTASRKLEDFQNGNLLASRFFAPKIVDYTKSSVPPYVPGWRKLVQLKALASSPADAAGVKTAYILFNFVKADVVADPFEKNDSKNNQVILVPKAFQAATEDSAIFMVFLQGPQYPLGFALQGVAFDLPGPADYFVPGSCAQCHGHDQRNGPGSPVPADGIYRQARLNYLDTDQWHDAMEFDFPQLKNSPWSVVFDGGKDIATARYKRAMTVIRQLNDGIKVQNASISSGDFKLKAVEKWLQVHATQDGPVAAAQRALEVVPGQVWNPANADEQELLKLLNHYCFRCHSSIRYNVFDKDGVSSASGGFKGRLTAPTTNLRYMPQGRELPPVDRDRIIELADKL